MSSGEDGEEKNGISLRRAGSVRELRAMFEGAQSPLAVNADSTSPALAPARLLPHQSSPHQQRVKQDTTYMSLPSPKSKRRAPARKLRDNWTRSMVEDAMPASWAASACDQPDPAVNTADSAQGQCQVADREMASGMDLPKSSSRVESPAAAPGVDTCAVDSGSDTEQVTASQNGPEADEVVSQPPPAPPSSPTPGAVAGTIPPTSPGAELRDQVLSQLAKDQSVEIEVESDSPISAPDESPGPPPAADPCSNTSGSSRDSSAEDTTEPSDREVQQSLLRRPNQRHTKAPPLTVHMPLVLQRSLEEAELRKAVAGRDSGGEHSPPSPEPDGEKPANPSSDLGSAIKHLHKELEEMRHQDIALLQQLQHMESLLNDINVRMRQSRSEPSWTMTLPSPVRKHTYAPLTELGRVVWTLGSEGSDASSYGGPLTRCQSQTSAGSPSSEDEVLVPGTPGTPGRPRRSFSMAQGASWATCIRE